MATRSELDAEYDVARLCFNKASKAFREAQESYRARITGDSDYLLERDKFNAASQIFDDAESLYIKSVNDLEREE